MVIIGFLFMLSIISIMAYLVYSTFNLTKMKNKYEDTFVDWNGVRVYVQYIYSDGKQAHVVIGPYDYVAKIKELKPIKAEVIEFPVQQSKNISL